MINSLLTGLVTGLIVLSGLLFLFLGVYCYAKKQFNEYIRANLYSPDGDSPSNFALVVQSIAGVFGTEIAHHLKAVFLGLQSVEAKNERREAANALINNHSVLGAIAASFPAVAKKMKNNPALAQLAMMALEKTKPGPAPEQTTDEPLKFDY